ncbi:unnamed protein product [Mytilus coruscus]|uniref:Reverse transcriptase domain-containing protein n=1 Tax=Mytilus coruscus TaxID=42192 RepID=A0A6J8B580_MYTCO|nr:unnamed protein product [Mytilus coruscus]
METHCKKIVCEASNMKEQIKTHNNNIINLDQELSEMSYRVQDMDEQNYILSEEIKQLKEKLKNTGNIQKYDISIFVESRLEAFEEIENELTSFTKVSDVHTALIGDFKAKAGNSNDFALAYDILLDLFHLDTDNEIISYIYENEDIHMSSYKNKNIEILNSEVTTEEVQKAAKKLKFGKASGTDGILNEMLKITCNINAKVFVCFFNAILKGEIYPDLWRENL